MDEGLKVRGMFRVQLVDPDGTIAGDSGFITNLVTNDGFNQYLVSTLGAIAGSKQVGYVALGTGAAPAAAETALAGEVSVRAAVTPATSATSKTVRFTATFESSNSFVTATKNIANIGLFDATVSGAGTIFAGNTFASSSCAVNQNVNVTYDIIFA